MTIGVFDSGVGGLSVANAIRSALPGLEVLYRDDKKNLPYGTKSPEQLLSLVTPILEAMVEEECTVIVVACNTVTTNIIAELRQVIKVPLVGMEPMVKTAAEQTTSGIVAIFATPATLKSKRYEWLKHEYAKGITVLEPDCSAWAQMVEQNDVVVSEIQTNVDTVLEAGADIIVLGCTHYHWIEVLINSLVAGKAIVLQPEQPVITHLKAVLAQLT